MENNESEKLTSVQFASLMEVYYKNMFSETSKKELKDLIRRVFPDKYYCLMIKFLEG